MFTPYQKTRKGPRIEWLYKASDAARIFDVHLLFCAHFMNSFIIFVISAEVTEFSCGGLVIKLHVSKHKQYGGMVCSLRFNFISKQYYALLHRIIADYGLSTEHETKYYRNRKNKQIKDFPCRTHIIFVKKGQ